MDEAEKQDRWDAHMRIYQPAFNNGLERAAMECESAAEESKGSDKSPEFWLLTAANRIRGLR